MAQRQSRRRRNQQRQQQRQHCLLVSTKWETMEKIRAQKKVVEEIRVTLSMMRGVLAYTTTQEDIDSKQHELTEEAQHLVELQEYYTYMDRFKRVD